MSLRKIRKRTSDVYESYPFLKNEHMCDGTSASERKKIEWFIFNFINSSKQANLVNVSNYYRLVLQV